MGSIPLITSISDTRNLLTFIAVFAAILFAYRGIMDFEVSFAFYLSFVPVHTAEFYLYELLSLYNLNAW